MKKTASEKNQIAGARLKYMMSIKGKRDVDLINYVLDYTDLYVSAPMMSQYLKGTKHIPQDIAIAFAECLDIDAGYILGSDGYASQNNDYYVYQSVMGLKDRWKKMHSQTDKYNKYLSHEGYFIKSFTSNGNDKITNLTISDKNEKEYVVSLKDANQYIKDIQKYYKDRTKQLLKNYLERK